jgi:hypothetical protein
MTFSKVKEKDLAIFRKKFLKSDYLKWHTSGSKGSDRLRSLKDRAEKICEGQDNQLNFYLF